MGQRIRIWNKIDHFFQKKVRIEIGRKFLDFYVIYQTFKFKIAQLTSNIFLFWVESLYFKALFMSVYKKKYNLYLPYWYEKKTFSEKSFFQALKCAIWRQNRGGQNFSRFSLTPYTRRVSIQSVTVWWTKFTIASPNATRSKPPISVRYLVPFSHFWPRL